MVPERQTHKHTHTNSLSAIDGLRACILLHFYKAIKKTYLPNLIAWLNYATQSHLNCLLPHHNIFIYFSWTQTNRPDEWLHDHQFAGSVLGRPSDNSPLFRMAPAPGLSSRLLPFLQAFRRRTRGHRAQGSWVPSPSCPLALSPPHPETFSPLYIPLLGSQRLLVAPILWWTQTICTQLHTKNRHPSTVIYRRALERCLTQASPHLRTFQLSTFIKCILAYQSILILTTLSLSIAIDKPSKHFFLKMQP